MGTHPLCWLAMLSVPTNTRAFTPFQQSKQSILCGTCGERQTRQLCTVLGSVPSPDSIGAPKHCITRASLTWSGLVSETSLCSTSTTRIEYSCYLSLWEHH